MKRMKNNLNGIVALCTILFCLVLLVYGIYFFIEQAQVLEDRRREEAASFMEEGMRKYRIESCADANLDYIDIKGKVRAVETELMLFDIYDEVIEPYILGQVPTLGSFQLTEGERTLELIQNFNDNMKHIKIWNEQEGRYRTISENEGLEEFEDIESFEELWKYMNKRNDEGVLYINELETIGYDRTEQDGEFIYDYGDGKNKKLRNKGLSLLELFREKYED